MFGYIPAMMTSDPRKGFDRKKERRWIYGGLFYIVLLVVFMFLVYFKVI